MSGPRQIYEFLRMASIAHAKWDYEVSMSIIHNRKKLLILGLLLLPILAVSLTGAEDIIGGKTAYAPAHYTDLIFLVSIAVGLAAGLITGCIGAGGGFIITPALMAAGVKGILAVGTDVFHIFAKAIMGTAVHRKLGNVSVKLAIAFLVGSGGGTFIGGAINKGLYNYDPLLSDAFISTVYAVLLGFLGTYAFVDYWKATRKQAAASDAGGHGAHGGSSGMTSLSVNLQKINIPPMISFDEDFGGRRISWLFVAIGGLIVGMLAAIMGVGRFCHLSDVCLYLRRIDRYHSRHRHTADHFHRRSCLNRPICDLRLCILHAGNGNAHRFAHRHPGGSTHHESRQRYPYQRILRDVNYSRFYKQGIHIAQEDGRTRVCSDLQTDNRHHRNRR